MHLLLCRPGFESALLAESAAHGLTASSPGDGLVQTNTLPADPAIFERQRIPNASFLPTDVLRPLGEETAGAILAPLHHIKTPVKRWSIHAYTPDGADANKAEGFSRALLRLAKKLAPELHAQFRPKPRPDQHILQLCRSPAGLFHGVAPFADLSSPKPGGIHRMTLDPDAPSRSFLKLEEALARRGWIPEHNQTVIDLGAAPGGWTHAFIKRGCIVTAVDNGPLAVSDPALEHVQADGISYPPEPIDWLVADMLIPPGTCLGMLRRWLPEGFPRRAIVNIKLPQQDLIPALQPLRTWLAAQPYRVHLRQLYHDRREVTLMAERIEPA